MVLAGRLPLLSTNNCSPDYQGRMSEIDWLSRLLQLIDVTGKLEVRCNYGSPWRVAWPRAAAREIPFHVVLKGRAIIEDPDTRTARELTAGEKRLIPYWPGRGARAERGKARWSAHATSG